MVSLDLLALLHVAMVFHVKFQLSLNFAFIAGEEISVLMVLPQTTKTDTNQQIWFQKHRIEHQNENRI